MNLFERLESQTHDEGIAIDRSHTLESASGALITIDGCPPIIHLSPALGQAAAAGVLAEELGHYYTGTGDDGFEASRQQIDRAEVRALRSAVRDVLQLHPDRIIKLLAGGITSFDELAESLEISEEFLNKALSAWIAEYGPCYHKDNCRLTFEPLVLYIEPRRTCIRVPVFSPEGLTKWWLRQLAERGCEKPKD